MTTLLKFELRKILGRRRALAALLGVGLLSLFLGVSAYLNMYIYDGVSREGKGAAAVALDKELAVRYAGVLTDGKVQQMLADFAPGDLHGLNAVYLNHNSMQSAVFYRFAALDGGWNGRTVAEVYGGETVRVGYVTGWLTTSQNMVRSLLALALVNIWLLAPVFAGEYAGVDNILLTSRYGRSRACLAKVLAGGLAALLTTAVVLALHLGLGLALYGAEGLDCSILFAPLEFSECYIPFNISCGTLLVYQCLLAFAGALGTAGLALLFSSLCRSPLTAFGAAAGVYLLPFLLPVAENSQLFRLVGLLPIYQIQFVSLMAVEQLNGDLLYAVWALPAAVCFFVLGAALAWRVFASRQVM